MSSIREIIVIVGAVAGTFGTVIPLIVSLVRKVKQLARERNWNKITEVLPSLIIEAERFANYTGTEKKEYVKSRLAIFAVKNRITFDETKFDTAIDDIVRLTKEVNQRSKDMIPQELRDNIQSVVPLY